jgi:hypothetical protein
MSADIDQDLPDRKTMAFLWTMVVILLAVCAPFQLVARFGRNARRSSKYLWLQFRRS